LWPQTPGTGAFAEVEIGQGGTSWTVRLVMLPWAMRDRVYTVPNLNCADQAPSDTSGTQVLRPAVLISEEEEEEGSEDAYAGMLLQDSSEPCTLHLRTRRAKTSFWVAPRLPAQQRATPDGVFTKVEVSGRLPTVDDSADDTTGSSSGGGGGGGLVPDSSAIPPPKLTLVKPAQPPRHVKINPHSHKAQEPTAAEWALAAEYTITLAFPSLPVAAAGEESKQLRPSHLSQSSLLPPKGWQRRDNINSNASWELTLAIDYAGDAARVYFKDRLLTDNWYSGYRGDGALQVGLSYLSGENPGLLEDGAQLTLLVLPLKKSTLEPAADPEVALLPEGKVFLQKEYWPEQFGGAAGASSVLNVSALRWLVTARVPLTIGGVSNSSRES
jgi:hypothetical protein